MAALDNDHLVVRVVYTGPPMAGKTQSVRALLPLLKGKGAEQRVLSPGEWRGRTAFFDWADYEGGVYEGRPIRCQILSTPGQVALSDRRELLLRSADAVILVVASQAEAMERAAQCYEEMAPWLAEAGRDVPIGLLLQCNKQDLPGALPPEELARSLALPCGNDVFGTSARTGKGLRAAFVAGVRRAVERARALVGQGLVLEPPDIASGEGLFEHMRREVGPIGSNQPGSARAAGAPERGASVDARAAGPRGHAGTATARPAASSSRAPSRPSRSGLYPSSAPSAPSSRPAPASRSTAASGSSPAVASGDPGSTAGAAAPPRRVPTARAGVAAPAGGAAAPRAGAPSAAGSPAAPRASVAAARAPGTSSSPAARARPSERGNRVAGGAASSPARGNPLAGAAPVGGGAASSRAGAAAGAASARGGGAGGAASSRAGGAGGAAAGTASSRAGGAGPAAEAGDADPAWSPRDQEISSTPSRVASNPAPRTVRPQPAPIVRAPATRQEPRADAPATSGDDRAVARAASSTSASRPPPRTPALVVGAARADSVTLRAPASLEAEPASSARQAIVPPRAEPPPSIEARAALDEALPRRDKGSLDPAGAAARAWRPGSGRRPAIMPASAYHAWVPASSKPSSDVQLRHAAGKALADQSDAVSPGARDSSALAPALQAPKARPRTPAEAGIVAPPSRRVAGGIRPAVMPASAYFAELAQLSKADSGRRDATSADSRASSASPHAARRADSSVPPTHTSREARPSTPVGESASEAPAAASARSSDAPLPAPRRAAPPSFVGAKPEPAPKVADPAEAVSRATPTRAASSSASREKVPASARSGERSGESEGSAAARSPRLARGEPGPSSRQATPSSTPTPSRAPTSTTPSSRATPGHPSRGEAVGPTTGRPAVMPASAYFAALDGPIAGAAGRAVRTPKEDAARIAPGDSDAVSRRRAASRHGASSGAPPRHGASSHASSQAAASDAAASRSSRAKTARATGVRPAVMPASAYFAALEGASGRAAASSPGAEKKPAEHTLPRAVTSGEIASPATASSVSRVQAPASTATVARTTPASESVPEGRAEARPLRGWDNETESERAPSSRTTPSHASGAKPSTSTLARPAVMPASAYYAGLESQGDERGAPGVRDLAEHPDAEPRVAVVAADAARTRDLSSPAESAPAPRDARGREPASVVGVPPADGARKGGPGSVLDIEGTPHDEASRSLREPRARPAVMPASAYWAALAAGTTVMATPASGSRAERSTRAGLKGALPTPAGQAKRGAPAPPAAFWSRRGLAPGQELDESSVQRSALAKHAGARPAVMPASAWRASLLLDAGDAQQREVSGSAPSDAGASEARATGVPPTAGELGEAVSGGKASAPPSLRLLQGGTKQRRADPARPPGQRPPLTLLPRPAVMPASAWHGGASQTRGQARARSVERDVGRRPAVMPASAWQTSLRAEPQVSARHDLPDATAPDLSTLPLDVAAAATPPEAPPAAGGRAPDAERSGSRATEDEAFAASRSNDDAVPGQELVEPPPAVDEPSQAFQIPETPPGLQAFVAAGHRALSPRLSAPHSSERAGRESPSAGIPAPLVSDVGAAPSTPLAAASEGGHSPDFAAPAGEGSEGAALFSFPGPNLPGHARPPLAVWRRSCWRQLETQSSAFASTLQDARGRWIGELAPGWFARTLRSASDLRSGRRAFAQEVLRQRQLGRYISRPRCVVLTEEADRFWVWQVVGRVPTLTTALRPRVAARPAPGALAEALLDVALGYLDARESFSAARVPLPLSPYVLSPQHGKTVYAGLMPDPGAVFTEPAGKGDVAFEGALREILPEAPSDTSAVLAELHGKAAGRLPEPLLEIIRRVIEGR